MIGETVGNFEIISYLGKGGMGAVYLAQQKAIKTKVAIKVLQADISKNTTHVQRFFNEAVAVGQIHHSGILKIFDVGFLPGGEAYLVMEYLQGETLTSRIKGRTRLGIGAVADFGRQIASVLEATHTAGITHRDLKPDNIYLVRDAELANGERVKVLDFGIAKLVPATIGTPRMTALGASSIGTPNYMSPEQWHSLAEVDWRTDAYALGCVAFEMACGRPPFIGESMADICAHHLSELPPVPSALVPGLPPELDRLIASLLEKDPEARPTMREAMQVFSALGRNEGIALTTLPPKLGMMSPFANQPAAAAPTAMSPMAQAVKPRRIRLVLSLLAAGAIAATVVTVVILASRGSSNTDAGSTAGSALASKPAPPAPRSDAATLDATVVPVRDATAIARPDAAVRAEPGGGTTARIIPDRLTASQVDHAVRAAANGCKGASGSVTVTLSITPDGTIANATMSPVPPVTEAIVQCIGAAVNRATFPRSKRGGDGSVTFDFGAAPTQPGSGDSY